DGEDGPDPEPALPAAEGVRKRHGQPGTDRTSYLQSHGVRTGHRPGAARENCETSEGSRTFAMAMPEVATAVQISSHTTEVPVTARNISPAASKAFASSTPGMRPVRLTSAGTHAPTVAKASTGIVVATPAMV